MGALSGVKCELVKEEWVVEGCEEEGGWGSWAAMQGGGSDGETEIVMVMVIYVCTVAWMRGIER